MSVSNVAKWVTTDGGSTQARVPLPQDRAWGTANSFTGASTLTMDCPRIGSIDLSAVTQAVTWALGNAISVYKSYRMGVNITQTGNYLISYLGDRSTNGSVYLGSNHPNKFNIILSNTFNNITIDSGQKLYITSGTTQTYNSITANGYGNQITISGVTAATYTLARAGGNPNTNVQNCLISYCISTGGAFYDGGSSLDGGNNTGITFGNNIYSFALGVTSFALTALNATFPIKRQLPAAVTTYVITGINAGLKVIRKLTASAVSFAITTVNALFGVKRQLPTVTQSYTITTIATPLTTHRSMPCIVQSYSLTFLNASFHRLLLMSCTKQTYSITAGSITLQRILALQCLTQSYHIIGLNASFQRELSLSVAPTNYSITGLNASFNRILILQAITQHYNITMQEASILIGWPMYVSQSNIWTQSTIEYLSAGTYKKGVARIRNNEKWNIILT